MVVTLLLASLIFATKTNVMLPLTTVSNSGYLDQNVVNKLSTLKSANIHGVMVDVWWGIAEPSPKSYNFAPYIKLAQECQNRGLKMQCVMSFHQCGGNVGDTCSIPIPSWLPRSGYYYKDQWGHEDLEYLSLSADNVEVHGGRTALQMYADFMTAFRNAMGSLMGSVVDEIQVGVGPCGELRYPGYQMDRWSFPGIGAFQCFDSGMLASLKSAGAAAGHPEWNSPPTDAGGYNSRPYDTNFFNNGQYSDFGKFFLKWYSDSLLEHGRLILTEAKSVFGQCSGVELACKISGIHWWVKHNSRAAEATTGYYLVNGNNWYLDCARMFKSLGVAFDFTCFEMRNHEQDSNAGCGPEDLVYQVLQACSNAGCAVCAENALERYDSGAYNTIVGNCQKGTKVSAFTYLRLTDQLINNGGFFSEFKLLVRKLAGV